ncbi:unnamed protein product [Lactuca virosa]|uniref:DNA2/NAM7 helicase-like C-terminal domain-containing protein n=1 Tax=Lactuca virosa TaxID=75947 RepID=A0AAU9NS48_9ASTR|nr:unnamed protein product [Lactuca virosa]
MALSNKISYFSSLYLLSIRKPFVTTTLCTPSLQPTRRIRVKLVRVGHPARSLPQVLDSALDAQIKAHASVAGHTLHELEGVEKSSCSTEPTLLLIDIEGCDMEEKKDYEESTLNEGEAEIAIPHARRLIQIGVHASNIGVITPYSAQQSALLSVVSRPEIAAAAPGIESDYPFVELQFVSQSIVHRRSCSIPCLIPSLSEQ